MNLWKKSLVALLVVVLCTPMAQAHAHPEDVPPTMSTWAAVEVNKARTLGLVSPDGDYLPGDYRSPITRRQFCMLAMRYMALQYHCSEGSFVWLSSENLRNQEGNLPKDAFIDGNREETVAYYLGVVEGSDKGFFEPDRLVTRQEAATILMRAYRACGGTLPEGISRCYFSDRVTIADWAKESVAVLNSWKVLYGRDNGTFAPKEFCSVEESLFMFLRLYENAPVSRKNGTVTPRFTYEKSLYEVTHFDNFMPTLIIEGKKATLVESSIISAPHSAVSWYFVYRDGGSHVIDWGVCMHDRAYPKLENPRFSEDGDTFYCTITLDQDYWHPKGVYHITMDVDTCQYQIQREDLTS